MKIELGFDERELIKDLYLSGESASNISKKIGFSTTVIYRVLREDGVKIRSRSENSRKYSLNENYFSRVDSGNKAYFLGFLFADGYNNEKRNCVELSCCEKDFEILDKLNKEIESNKPIRKVINKGIISYKSHRIDWCSSKLSKDLAKLGCIKKKTFLVTFPEIDKELVSHFLRGYFDGDGCISYSFPLKNNFFGNSFQSVITFVGTEEFLLYLKNLLFEELRVNSIILNRHPENGNNIRTLQISGNKQVCKLSEYLYKDCDIFLERKFEKYLEIKNILEERKFYYKNNKKNKSNIILTQ